MTHTSITKTVELINLHQYNATVYVADLICYSASVKLHASYVVQSHLYYKSIYQKWILPSLGK